MKKYLVLALLPLLITLVATPLKAENEKGFVSLFDGKTFKGWEGDTKKTFRIVDGAVVAGSLKTDVPRNEFLCTEKKYGDFELRLKAKLIGKGKNAGIQFRSRRIPNHHELYGYQCDMGANQERLIWGSLYDESRRKKFLAQGDHEKLIKVFKKDDWNYITIRCQGNRIQIWVNQLKTVDYVEREKEIATSGIIGLQIHGGQPAEASYKEIRIKELNQ